MPIPTAMMPGPSILPRDAGSGRSRVTGARAGPRSVVGRVNAMVPPGGEAVASRRDVDGSESGKRRYSFGLVLGFGSGVVELGQVGHHEIAQHRPVAVAQGGIGEVATEDRS